MISRRNFYSIFTLLFISFLIDGAEPKDNLATSNQPELREVYPRLSERATFSEDRRTKILIKRRRKTESAQQAVKELRDAVDKTNQDVKVIGGNGSAAKKKEAALDGMEEQSVEDKSRKVLSEAAGLNNGAVKKANREVKEKGPYIVKGFEKIKNNPKDQKNVESSLDEIADARKVVKQANKDLIEAATGGDHNGGGKHGGKGGAKGRRWLW